MTDEDSDEHPTESIDNEGQSKSTTDNIYSTANSSFHDGINVFNLLFHLLY